jgi:hypothetical protein
VSLAQDVDGLLDNAARRSRNDDVLAPFKTEINEYIEEMRGLSHVPPDEAMGWLSSVSARILQMIMTTLDYDGRLPTKFRVEVLLPVRDELRYQLQIASRRHSVTQLDWEISGKQAV